MQPIQPYLSPGHIPTLHTLASLRVLRAFAVSSAVRHLSSVVCPLSSLYALRFTPRLCDALPILCASYQADDSPAPFFTLAIPHYNLRPYLEVALDSIFAQRFRDFEIVVSDDVSHDDSAQVIPARLQASGVAFRYYLQPANLGFSGNMRFCLRAARGRYVLFLGNDDALQGPNTLAEVTARLHQLNLPEIAFTNYEDWASPGNPSSVVRRAIATRVLGSGPQAAVRFFRSFSFIGGLIFDQKQAVRHETARWDGSVYYQMYLACRVLAAGGRLGAIDLTAVRKDVRVEGRTAPNYVSRWTGAQWSFERRPTGLESVLQVSVSAVLPYLPKGERSATVRRMLSQLLLVTYPFWLLEYRRVANWSFSVGIARGLWPGALLAGYRLASRDRLFLWALYLAVTLAALVLPVRLCTRLGPRLAGAVRKVQQSRHKAAHTQ